jgi:Cu/Ag efflux protein CusF
MRLRRLTLSSVLVMALMAMASFIHAQNHEHGSSSSEMTENLWTMGEVRKIDLSQKKITIRHDEIKNLQMPAMTMIFIVKDVRMIDSLQPGDQVKFKAYRDNGHYFVDEIQHGH